MVQSTRRWRNLLLGEKAQRLAWKCCNLFPKNKVRLNLFIQEQTLYVNQITSQSWPKKFKLRFCPKLSKLRDSLYTQCYRISTEEWLLSKRASGLQRLPEKYLKELMLFRTQLTKAALTPRTVFWGIKIFLALAKILRCIKKLGLSLACSPRVP